MKSLSNTVIAAVIALGLTLLVAVLPKLPFFGALEDHMGDQLMKLSYILHQKFSPRAPDTNLVFADIDEKTVQEFSQEGFGNWPFPRSVHGAFLQGLAPEKPKVVGWDILFTESSSRSDSAGSTNPPDNSTATPTPAAPDTNAPAANPPNDSATTSLPEKETDDEQFANAAALLPHVVSGAKREESAPKVDNEVLKPTVPLTHVAGDISKLLSSSAAIYPFPALRKNSFFGFVDEDSGNGGVRRTMPLVVNIGGQVFASFDLQVILQFWGADPDKVTVDLGHQITATRADGSVAHIPIDNYGYLTINYRMRLEDLNDKKQAQNYAGMAVGLAVRAGAIEKPEESQKAAEAKVPAMKDKIVIIGVTIAGTDAGVTPLDGNAPLVSTHLNVLNNILQGDYVHPLTGWAWIPLYALFLFGAGNLMLRIGVVPLIPIGLLAMFIVAAASFGALWFGNLQVPVAFPEIGILVLAGLVPTKRFFGEEKEKIRIRKAMGAYLSEKIMNSVLEHPDGVKLGGVKQEITVMFCDIRGFTKYCDDRDPQEVLNVVNDYFEEMTQVVFKYDGTVDKYIGDCIMAFWNAPAPQPDHAQRAVCCAMEMRYALANFKTKRAGKDTELFECGIGLHTGEALVGNMGSSLKLNYTAMGSTVNMGARLEALTKRLNERILISEAVKAQLTGDFPLTDRGEAVVPGFAAPVHVYAVGADQDIGSALKVGRVIATQQEYTADEVTAPIWKPAPLPSDADPSP